MYRGVEKMLHLLGLFNFHDHACMSRLLDTIPEKNKRAFAAHILEGLPKSLLLQKKNGTLGNSNQLASSGETENNVQDIKSFIRNE